MRIIPLFLIAVLLPALAQSKNPPIPAAWNHFSNRDGWSMRYPPHWTTASCMSCPDPHARGVYVDFFPPRDAQSGGWVMVEHLESKPAKDTLASWFQSVARSADLNPQISASRTIINGNPALTVLYRNSDNTESEETYIVSGTDTYQISFSGNKPGPVQTAANYHIYRQILSSFESRITTR